MRQRQENLRPTTYFSVWETHHGHCDDVSVPHEGLPFTTGLGAAHFYNERIGKEGPPQHFLPFELMPPHSSMCMRSAERDRRDARRPMAFRDVAGTRRRTLLDVVDLESAEGGDRCLPDQPPAIRSTAGLGSPREEGQQEQVAGTSIGPQLGGTLLRRRIGRERRHHLKVVLGREGTDGESPASPPWRRRRECCCPYRPTAYRQRSPPPPCTPS
jgi:hypothetical protein